MHRLFSVVFLLTLSIGWAQKPAKPSAVDIYHQIQKLNFLGTALYIAAHPDDENTRLISYLANHHHARTGYLSLTRGDGGQNLIGPELREVLGVIRTQELVEARKIDGGEQIFSRANDFGYSKTPDETFRIWNREQVLEDVVLAIRKFRPDIIINRFDHRTPGTTHGHHTASAILSLEAFDKAADRDAYPDQLKKLSPWQPQRAFFNTSWFFYGSQEKFDKADKSKFLGIDIGTYYASRGLSNQEIAALSRSCHQSQGFGTTGTRGADTEYLELLRGKLPASTNLFEGIDTTWNRVPGGKPIGEEINQILEKFDFSNPGASVTALLSVYQKILKIDDEHWRTLKASEAADIIAACVGLYLEVSTPSADACPGTSVRLQVEAINRSTIPMELESVTLMPIQTTLTSNRALSSNRGIVEKTEVTLPRTLDFTAPYWLRQNTEGGMYEVSDASLIGLPETPRALFADFTVSINGTRLIYRRDVVCKYNDDAKGESYKPFDIVPDVSLAFQHHVTVFTSREKTRKVEVRVRASKQDVRGKLSMIMPDEWKISPEAHDFALSAAGEETVLTFSVTPPAGIADAMASLEATIDGRKFGHTIKDIRYDHIPRQTVLLPAQAHFIKPDLKTGGEKIAYIMGAGDEIPAALQQMGYQVTILPIHAMTPAKLAGFDAVITGVRAYNKITELGVKQKFLLDYTASGGTLIVQYNTLDDLTASNMSPYKLKISRDRVTDENAEVRFLDPDHPLLNSPNRITSDDFVNWRQEIGLYFPSEWGSEFTPVLSANDPGEKPKDGLLLVAKYGKGHYIYTGISFFRQLREGVPGAFRLMANLISIK